MVSIIIPAYKSEKVIGAALDSALLQESDALAIEIIVIVDGRDDPSAQAVEHYARARQRTDIIRVIIQENQGPSGARNTGIRSASADLIAFLDADDRWLPGKLEAQIDFLDRHPECAAVGTTKNGALYRNKGDFIEPRFFDLLWKNYLCTSSVLARKQELIAAGGFVLNKKYSEDYELWLSIAATSRVAVLNKPLVEYAEGGISSRLWPMEKGELATLRAVGKRFKVKWPVLSAALAWSMIKFCKRLIFRCAHVGH